MKSLKLLIIGLFILVSSNVVTAQGQGPSEEQKAQMAEEMEAFVATLNLTEDQKTEFKSINDKYRVQMEEVRDSGSGKFSKMRKLKSINKDKNKEVKAILNDDQYDLYLVQQEKMKKKMKERRNGKS